MHVIFADEISPCVPNPCQYDGSCIIVSSSPSYKCECKPGFASAKCEDGEYVNLENYKTILLECAYFDITASGMNCLRL